jgi:DNA-binding CsgD family transcriptional regulator
MHFPRPSEAPAISTVPFLFFREERRCRFHSHNPELAEHTARELAAGSPALPHQGLSDREFEVLRLIASARTPTEIAAHLSLSVKTISTFRTRLLHKMGMRHNAKPTHYAIANRLVF